MSDLYDQIFADRGAELDIVSANKRESVAAATEQKRQAAFEQFNPDEWVVIDTDTLAHKTRKTADGRTETMRFGLPEGHSFDAFETRKPESPEEKAIREAKGYEYRSEGRDPYADNPTKADFHRQALAKQLNKPVSDVSNDDLYNAGLAQKQRLIDGIESLRGQNYTPERGEDEYGRVLGRFENPKAFDQISGGINAGYYSPYNSKRQVEDFHENGAPSRAPERSYVQALTGDALASAFSGGANALNSIAQFGSVISTKLTDMEFTPELLEFYQNNEQRIKKISDALSSEEKIEREAFDAKEQEFLDPLFQARLQEYKKADPALEDWQATFLATKDEYADRLEYLSENPGRILDATFESVPYMLGIGAIGRTVAKKATESLGRKTLGQMVAAGATETTAKSAATAFVQSKAGQAIINKAAERAGIVAIAATEATMNAATVYGQVVGLSKEQISQSEEYQKLIKRGLSHQEAADKMANAAFNKTFYWNFALAGIASKVSGAGGFEANLLRGMGMASERGILKTLGNTAGQAAIAGTREFVEETAQSGGGELVSQIASAEATGEPIGKGVGKAAAEGGVVGFASGAGLSAATGSVKDIVRGGKAAGKALSQKDTRHVEAATGIATRAEGSINHGGSAAETQATIKEAKSNATYNADQSVNEILDLADEDKTQKRPSVRLANVLNAHYAELKKPSEETKRRVKQYRAEYKTALKFEVDTFAAQFEAGEITAEQVQNDPATKALLAEASMVFKNGTQVETNDEDVDGFLSSAREVQKAVDTAILSAATNSQYSPDVKNIDDVNEQKMGYGTHQVNGHDRLGLQAHAVSITEAITSGNNEEYKLRDGKLRVFLNSQTTKLRAYNALFQAIINPGDKRLQHEKEEAVSKEFGVKVRYEPSSPNTLTGTAALIKVMGEELVTMGNVRKALGELAANKLTGITPQASRNAIQAPVSGKLNIPGIEAIIKKTETDVERSETNLERDLLKEKDEVQKVSPEASEASASTVKPSNESLAFNKPSEPEGKDSVTDEEPKATLTSGIRRPGEAQPETTTEQVIVEELAEPQAKASEATITLSEEVVVGEDTVIDPEVSITETIVDAVDAIREGGNLKPNIMVGLKDSINFLSAKVVPHIAPLVNVFGDPTKEWSAKKLASTRAALTSRFEKLKMPTQLWKATENKRSRTKNILAAVPNVMSALQEESIRTSFLNAAQATDIEKEGMDGVIAFSAEFISTLDDLHLGLLEDLDDPNTTFKRNNLDDARTAITNPLQEYLFQLLLQPGVDTNGKDTSLLSEQIASIMAMEAGTWLSSAGASTLNNRDATINQFLGQADNEALPIGARKVLGNGTLHTNVARQIGAKVLSEINLQLNGNVEVSPAFQNTLEVSIGNMVTATMVKMGRAEISAVSGKYIQMNSVEDIADDTDMNLIYTKPVDSTATNGDQRTEIEANEELRSDFQSAARILKDYFSVVEYRRGPSLTAPETPTQVMGSLSKIPAPQRENIRKNSNIKHRPIKAMISELDRWKESLWLSEVMGSVSQEEINETYHTGDETYSGEDESTQAKNSRNERSLKQVRDWLAKNGTKPFYYTYNMISSHRIMIDSNTINAQADKMHRFLFGMKEWDVVMKSTSQSPRKYVKGTNEYTPQYLQLRAFKVSLALALDIDTEGQSTDAIIEAFDKKINEPVYKAAINIMRTKPDTYENMDMLTIGAAIRDAGEATHTLAGLRAWADFVQAGQEGKRTVRVTIPMETDGKTNGYAALLMQFAPRSPEELKELEPFYNAVGIFFKDGEFGSYPEFIQLGGGQDNYNGVTEVSAKNTQTMLDPQAGLPIIRTSALYISAEQQEVLDRLRRDKKWTTSEDSSILGYKDQKEAYLADNVAFQKSTGVAAVLASGFVTLNRAFAKGPLTQVAYSASMASVRRSLRKQAVNTFYAEIARAGYGMTSLVDVREAIADVIVRAASVRDAYDQKTNPDMTATYEATMETLNKIPTMAGLIKFRREFVMSEAGLHSFQGGIDLVYGHSLQSALEDRLEVITAMTTNMTDSVYMANLIFTEDFKRRIEHREKTEGTLVDYQRKEILNQMVREGLVPGVDTAMSQTQLDRLETTSMGQVALAGELKGRAYFKGPQQIHDRKFDQNGESLMDKDGNEIKPPKQSSSVSALMGINPNMNLGVASIAMATHSSDGSVNGDAMGKYPILNLFDAQFGNFEQIVEVGQFANQKFFEHHRNWNMGQAFYESLERLLPLIADDDSRLSNDAKLRILDAFQKQRIAFSGAVSYEEGAADHFTQWLDDFRAGVNENNESREALFAEIGYVNQFAKEDTIYTVPPDDKGAVNPKTASIVSETSWESGLLEIIRGDEATVQSRKKKQVITDINRELHKSNGKPRDVLLDWMDASGGTGHAPAAEDMLDVLYATFGRMGDSEQLAELINTIRPMLTWPDAKTGKNRVTQVVSRKPSLLFNKETNQQDDGRYYPAADRVVIAEDAKDILGTLLHEIVHAANWKQIERLGTAEDTKVFDSMLQDAKEWASANLNGGPQERKAALSIVAALSSKPGEDIQTTEQKADFKLRQQVSAISEYSAHLNTELRWNQGQYSFHFHTKADTDRATKALADSVQSRSGRRTYYSSPEEVQDGLFSSEHETMLTKENLTSVLEQLKANDNVTPEVQALFDHMISGVLGQGLASIDSVIFKLATKPNGERNVGKFLVEGGESTVYVQATDRNFDTNTVQMSQQEIAIHELLHAIFEYGINNNPSIMNTVDMLFDRTLNSLTEKYQGYDNIWKAFLPTDNNGNYIPGPDPSLDETLARERFEHIFGDPTKGKDYTDYLEAANPVLPTDKELAAAEKALKQAGNQGKHEFMAMGLSNPQFIKILQSIDTSAPGPIWVRGEIIPSIFRAFQKVVNILKGEVFTDHPTDVSSSLEKLAKKIVTFNTKQQALAKKAADEGAISKRLNALNNYAVYKLAGLVNSKMAAWAEENSQDTSSILQAQRVEEVSRLATAITMGKSMTASVLRANMEQFRDALDAAVVEKDHWMYEMLTEILPWADRNRSWVDMLRRSEVLIDGRRQQLIEHTRTGLIKFFANAADFTPAMREAISNVMLKTDLTSLMHGPSELTAEGVLDLMGDRGALNQRIEAFEAHLQRVAGEYYSEMFNKQSHGLASYMVHGRVIEWMQQTNIYGIVAQRNIDERYRKTLDNAEEITDILEHLTTMRALALMYQRTVASVSEIMTSEMNRGQEMNGFTGMMGMAQAFKEESLEKLFRGNPSQMHKGYVYEVLDEEIAVESAAYTTPENKQQVIESMKAKGFKYIEDLPREPLDNNPVKMMLFKQNRGVPTYSKSYMSLTGEQKRGTGILDSMFAAVGGTQPGNVTAARAHAMLARTKRDAFIKGAAQFRPGATPSGVKMMPVYNEADEVVDFRYIMTEKTKKQHLKKRDYFDEVLPRMFASIEDRVNTKTINEEGIEKLYEEWTADQRNPNSESRYVAIGRNVDSPEGREMWALLPKATRIAVEDTWGDELFYVRDETVNLVLGFRKMSVANNEVLSPISPAVRIAEKIWQEIIQWERFRIAVLNPVVVIGNMVSNIAMLLSQGITPAYIWRMAKVAMVGMRKYQKETRARNELALDIQAAQAQHFDTRAKEAQLARLEANLNNNPVQELVEEGLFTSIVEEFGMDENSTRRKLTTMAMNKVGHATGSKMAVKVASEAMMVPGSELAQMALMATQYGDFVGRFIKFNWDTQVKKVDRRTAIHESLDSFIYYNIPQNRILQYMNDNGLMMFTKFFFRIQPIIGRTFSRNPVQASITMGMQHMFENRSVQENIANYAFMSGGMRKFDLTPWDRLTNGSIFEITALKWIPDIFWKD